MQNKILTVGPDYHFPNGGIAKLIETYSTFFNDFPFVATMRAPEQGKEGKVMTFARFVTGLVKMSYKILSGKSKIVHIHTASGITFVRESIYLYLASILGAKTILHMHSGSLMEFYSKHPKLVARTLKKADKVITIAEVWKDFLNSKGHDNVITIGNPIPTPSDYSSIPNDNAINVLFMGLICDNKGIWDIIDVFKQHKAEWDGKVILTIGGNGDVEKLLRLIKENNLENIVKYVGWINGEQKGAFLRQTDIYLQPSYKEALGIAILEAMSYKTPIIATNTGGIPEIVKNGENGILIEPGDKSGLAEAIKKLMYDKNLRIEMGERGFEIAQDYYPSRIKEKLTNLYERLYERIH